MVRKPKKEEGISVFGQHIPGSEILTRAATDVKDMVYNMPAGLYYTGQAAVHAVEGHPQELVNLGENIAKQMYADFQHPLRHPGNTLIDAMTVGSLGLGTAARFAEASRLIGAGKTAEAASVIIKGLKPMDRMVTYNGKEIQVGQYSRAGGMRAMQKAADALRQRYPQLHPFTPLFSRSMEERVSFHAEQQARVYGAEATANASVLMRYKTPLGLGRLGRKHPELQVAIMKMLPSSHRMSTPEAEALRLVGEQMPLSERIAYEEGQIAKGFGNKAEHESNLAILNVIKDRGYLVEKAVPGEVQPRLVKQIGGWQIHKPDGSWSKIYEKESTAKTQFTKLKNKSLTYQYEVSVNPAFPKLVKAEEQARAAALHRERAAIAKGLLTEEEAYARKVAPLLEVRGKLPEYQVATEVGAPAVKGQARLFRMETLEGPDFTVPNPQKLFRVPYSKYETRSSYRPLGVVRLGRGSQIGAKTPPGSFTHPFSAELLKSGAYRHDVMRLLAETDLEAQRFLTIMAFKAKILQIARPTPAGMKDPVAIRMEMVAGKAMPQATKALINKYTQPGVVLNSDEILALGEQFQAFAEEAFRTDLPASVGPKQGYMWIEKDVVRPFLEPEMLSSVRQVATGGKALRAADAINNALRLSFLYLKPAYAVPNFLGNLALSLTQQGFFSPYNLARSARLNSKLLPEEVARLDAMMGEGMARAMASGGRGGLLGETTDVAARFWGAAVDTPFRRASFLHEAYRNGFKTLDDVKRLLTDETLKDKMVTIALEANKEIVDFARLGPFEASVLRRVLFFYPWLKGSSVQFGRFLTEHPAKAVVATNLGEYGTGETTRRLGGLQLPSYLQGYIPVGGSRQHPQMVNPAAFSLFQTPGQAIETASEMLQGKTTPGFSPFSFVNPASEAAVNALTGIDPFTGRRIDKPLFDSIVTTLFGSAPLPLMIQRMTQDQSRKMFPMTPNQALAQYMIGLTPKTTSRARVYQATKRETQ